MLRRIFIKNKITDRELFHLDEESLNHAVNVLRLKNSDNFIAIDGSGNEYVCEITDRIKGNARILKLNNSYSGDFIPIINLYLSLIKQPRFEVALEKCTELGVSSITPIKTQNNLPMEMTENRIRRFNTILEQASRQCTRLNIPSLHPTLSFKEAIEQSKNGVVIIAHRDGNKQSLKPSTLTISDNEENFREHVYNIFIGPEGGFSAEELKTAQENNAKTINLGRNILRTETAAIAACSIIWNELFYPIHY